MRLQLFDVFSKTHDDAKVRTSSGGAVTLGAALLIIWLLFSQIRQFFTVHWEHQMDIDTSASDKMSIVLDIIFPNMPCELLNVDSVDDMGEHQQNLHADLQKLDLDANQSPLDTEILRLQRERKEQAISARPADYEGPCYGAENGLRQALNLPADSPVSCRTCEDVRTAYAKMNWQFHDGRGFEQCVDEGLPEALFANKDNGCRISGVVIVTKVVGRLHIAPGESRFDKDQHSHDTSTYQLDTLPYDFTHSIVHFGFAGADAVESQPQHHKDPLAGFSQTAPMKDFQFRYFIHVVGTDYTYRNGSILSTNQYSVTRHERPLSGGKDADHPHSLHTRGGIPGLWFNYDISPMRVREIETRQISFAELLMNVFAIVGAVITTAAVVDRGVYAVDQALKARKER